MLPLMTGGLSKQNNIIILQNEQCGWVMNIYGWLQKRHQYKELHPEIFLKYIPNPQKYFLKKEKKRTKAIRKNKHFDS